MDKFNNHLFSTALVQKQIPKELILFIISLIKELQKNIQIDYFQVFEIRKGVLTHTQEIPEYRKEYPLPILVENCKLFFIDSGEYSTLLFDHEY